MSNTAHLEFPSMPAAVQIQFQTVMYSKRQPVFTDTALIMNTEIIKYFIALHGECH